MIARGGGPAGRSGEALVGGGAGGGGILGAVRVCLWHARLCAASACMRGRQGSCPDDCCCYAVACRAVKCLSHFEGSSYLWPVSTEESSISSVAAAVNPAAVVQTPSPPTTLHHPAPSARHHPACWPSSARRSRVGVRDAASPTRPALTAAGGSHVRGARCRGHSSRGDGFRLAASRQIYNSASTPQAERPLGTMCPWR